MRNEREAHPQFSGWITEQGRLPVLSDEEIALLYAGDRESNDWEPMPDGEAIWMLLPFIAVWCAAFGLFFAWLA